MKRIIYSALAFIGVGILSSVSVNGQQPETSEAARIAVKTDSVPLKARLFTDSLEIAARKKDNELTREFNKAYEMADEFKKVAAND